MTALQIIMHGSSQEEGQDKPVCAVLSMTCSLEKLPEVVHMTAQYGDIYCMLTHDGDDESQTQVATWTLASETQVKSCVRMIRI